jgi:hypothetical protein
MHNKLSVNEVEKEPTLLHWRWVRQFDHGFGVINRTTDVRVEPSLLHNGYRGIFPRGKAVAA